MAYRHSPQMGYIVKRVFHFIATMKRLFCEVLTPIGGVGKIV